MQAIKTATAAHSPSHLAQLLADVLQIRLVLSADLRHDGFHVHRAGLGGVQPKLFVRCRLRLQLLPEGGQLLQAIGCACMPDSVISIAARARCVCGRE